MHLNLSLVFIHTLNRVSCQYLASFILHPVSCILYLAHLVSCILHLISCTSCIQYPASYILHILYPVSCILLLLCLVRIDIIIIKVSIIKIEKTQSRELFSSLCKQPNYSGGNVFISFQCVNLKCTRNTNNTLNI